MRIFIKLMSITMQQRMYYRVTFLLNLVTPLILLAGQLILWRSIYTLRSGETLGNMGQGDMYAYLLLAFLINSLLTWSSENTLAREIRSGQVTARRVRPAPFLMQTLADMCGNMLLQAVANVAMVVVIYIAMAGRVTLPSVQALPMFLLSLIMAMAVRVSLVSTFSLLCFYSTGHLGLTWTRTALTEFFSGALIPVSLFPGWLMRISYFTPFPLMLQVPVAIFLGQPLPMPVWATLALQAAWTALFSGLHALLYGHVRRHITLAGG